MRVRFARGALSALLILLTVTPATAQTDGGKLSLEKFLELERVGDPQLSPDGSQVIYTRGWIDKVNDSWESSLWIMGADGSKNRFLIDGSNARWSPDGSRIAYTARGEPSGQQIFVRWMDAEGAVSQITRLEKSPSNIAWSPDGEWIAFDMIVPNDSDPDWRIDLPARPEGAKWTESPRIVTRMNYRRDRLGYYEDGFRHIFVVPADGGTPRRITDGDWNHSDPQWTPDGRSIVFSSHREPEAEYIWRESEIYAVDVASGAIRQLTDRRGPDYAPVVSPDGRRVAYLGYDYNEDTYVVPQLHVMGVDGSEPRLISGEVDERAGGHMWAPDGSGVYFTVSAEGRRHLHLATLDGQVRQVTDGQVQISIEDIASNGLAVGTMSAPHEPGDIIALDLRSRNAQPRELTAVNDDILAGITLGDVEEIWYPSVGGERIQGWIVKPPDFDPSRQYPLMLSIHGGPHGMYGVGFNYGWQEHAANGYVVLYTNPRGSSGYGKDFGNLIQNAYPSQDFDDLMAGVDTVVNRGYVDTNRMYVYGCSGGGVLTAWTVGHTDRFAAASSNCPVINWLSFVGTTDGVGWYRNFKSYPWEDPTEHLQRSPLMYVGNVKTPTMLMTGVNDLRTPMPQTEEFYQALQVLKVPTAMVRFNEEWHGTSSKPSNFLRTQLYLRKWFERFTREDEARVTADASEG